MRQRHRLLHRSSLLSVVVHSLFRWPIVQQYLLHLLSICKISICSKRFLCYKCGFVKFKVFAASRMICLTICHLITPILLYTYLLLHSEMLQQKRLCLSVPHGLVTCCFCSQFYGFRHNLYNWQTTCSVFTAFRRLVSRFLIFQTGLISADTFMPVLSRLRCSVGFFVS